MYKNKELFEYVKYESLSWMKLKHPFMFMFNMFSIVNIRLEFNKNNNNNKVQVYDDNFLSN